MLETFVLVGFWATSRPPALAVWPSFFQLFQQTLINFVQPPIYTAKNELVLLVFLIVTKFFNPLTM